MIGEAERARLLFGTDEAVEPPRLLVAGALSAALTAGGLRSIGWQGLEILRGIAFVARDTRWGTYAPQIYHLEISVGTTAFSVRYDAAVAGAEGSFSYRVAITGAADGRLRFAADGSSAGGFATNRTGFVVLHGLEGVVGRPLMVRHPDGTTTQTRFPTFIQPDQPATAIAGLRHEPQPGLSVDVGFTGDLFEMEDHRNWTDASFKTYVRPLSRGYPYRIEPGEPLTQAVELTVRGAASPGPDAAAGLRVTWGSPEDGTLPWFGLYLDPESLSDAERHREAIAALRPRYLQARVALSTQGTLGRLDRVLALARSWQCPLHLDAIIPGIEPQAELAALATWAAQAHPGLQAVFVVPARDLRSRAAGATPSGEASAAAILAAARSALPGALLVGGMPVGFPELNRNPPPPGIDMVAHATQAIVHAADDRSVMETLEAFPHVVASTRRLVGSIPYRIGPATIGMPPSASASLPIENPPGRRVAMGSRDPRQRGLFAAAFMVGLVPAARDASHLTLAAPTGDIGVLDEDGAPRPVAMTFAELAGLSGVPRLSARSTAPDRVAALAALTDRGPVLVLANLTAEPVVVALDGPASRIIRMLDVEGLAGGNPFAEAPSIADARTRLDAYAVCVVEASA